MNLPTSACSADQNIGRPRILLGLTGSVATIVADRLVAQLLNEQCSVQCIVTQSAQYFLQPPELSIPVWKDQDEWPSGGYHRGDKILHIDLREWADMLLIAPLSANTLAKMATGICDNLLTSVIRAWTPTKPMILAPAMNTTMWEHPLTRQHLNILSQWYNLHVIPPISKVLACGDFGEGALAEVETIVATVMSRKSA